MKTPLERLNTLTLAAEAALASNDLPGFRALLDARAQELAKLRPDDFAAAEQALRLDARLQAGAQDRMNGLRARITHLAHVNRTARAARAAQVSPSQVDVSG